VITCATSIDCSAGIGESIVGGDSLVEEVVASVDVAIESATSVLSEFIAFIAMKSRAAMATETVKKEIFFDISGPSIHHL
jgi:hypothetical protein